LNISYLSVSLAVLGDLIFVKQFDDVGGLLNELASETLLLDMLEVVEKQTELLVEGLGVSRLVVELCSR
jgi:hypothetical protein